MIFYFTKLTDSLHSNRWRPVAIVLGFSVPLLALLYWAAETFPNYDDVSTLVPIDDHFTLILRSSYSVERWPSCVTRYRLLDNSTGRTRKVLHTLRDQGGLTSGGPPFLQVMANGTIVRSHEKTNWNWLVDITSPVLMTAQSVSTEQSSAIPVGDRFLVSPSLPERKEIRWFDLKEPTVPQHISPLTTYQTELHAISNNQEALFYDLYVPDYPAATGSMGSTNSMGSMDNPELTEVEPANPNSNTSTVPTAKLTEPTYSEESNQSTRPEWDAELKKLSTRSPKPHPSFIVPAMLVLYRMTTAGPVEIAHWPVPGELHYSTDFFVKADGPFIFCMSLDARSIEVHDANTGAVCSRIPLPPTIGLPSSIDWYCHRYAVCVSMGKNYQAFDPGTGEPLPSDPNYCQIFSRQGDRYIELAPHIPNTPIQLAFQNWPPHFQVRHYPTGEILANYRIPDPKVTFSWRGAADYPQLTADGQQIILHTADERMLFIDALTGRINRVIQAAAWPYYACLLIFAWLVLWCVVWLRIAKRAAVPRLVTMLVMTIMIIAFLTMRLQLSGNSELRLRLAAIGILAIATAWSAELVQHIVRPGCSLQSRTLSLSVYLICMALGHQCIIHHYDSTEAVLVWLYLNSCFALFYLCLVLIKRLTAFPDSQPQKFTVRSILVVTSLAAVVTSVAYRLSWNTLAPQTPMAAATILTVLTSIAALTLSVRHSFTIRWLAIPVCVTVAVIVAVIVHAYHQDLAPWCWQLSSYLACTAIAASFGVHHNNLSPLPPSSSTKPQLRSFVEPNS